MSNQGKSLNEAAGDRKLVTAEIVRSGTKLIIPQEMTLDDAEIVIRAKRDEEEQSVSLSETFDVFIWEGAFAMARALDTRYGWFQQVHTPGWFGEPPSLIQVKTGPDTTVQVPWGRFLLPTIPKDDGYLETGYEVRPGELVRFRLTAQLKKKHSREFHILCNTIREELKTTSLYKGKAITVKFHDDDGDRLPFPEPTFSRISDMSGDQLIFSRHIEDAVNVNLFTPIQHSETCREYKIPLKRGIMLAGTYGTGKTLVGARAATIARQNGWTYIFCTQTKDFPDSVKFAQRYQPAVVFCEDIDKATSGNRDEEMDRVLNTIDGVDSKNTEVILVVTTNEVEEIDQAMLRPGRFDAVIHFERPDAEAVTRLIRYYASDLMDKDEPLDSVGKLLADSTPAVVREVVERAKLAAVAEMEPGTSMRLTENALRISAETMKMHRDLMNRTANEPLEGMELLGNILGTYIANSARITVQANESTVSSVSTAHGLIRAKDVEKGAGSLVEA